MYNILVFMNECNLEPGKSGATEIGGCKVDALFIGVELSQIGMEVESTLNKKGFKLLQTSTVIGVGDSSLVGAFWDRRRIIMRI